MRVPRTGGRVFWAAIWMDLGSLAFGTISERQNTDFVARGGH